MLTKLQLQIINYHSASANSPRQPLSDATQRWPTNIPIDPALISLPNASDADLQDPVVILKAKGKQPVQKTAGSRKKDKPYLRVDDPQQAKRGRPAGTGNFNTEDKTELLHLIRNAVPLGQTSWKAIGRAFNEWAKHNRRPERPFKSLETKYKGVSCHFVHHLYTC